MENENKNVTQLSVLDVSEAPTLESLEQKYINMVLEKTGGNKPQAAKILGVSVKTIYNKLNSYQVPTNTSTP